MRVFLLLLVALAALEECRGGSKCKSRVKRDLLLRSKRRWVLSTIELEEEMKVTYPYKISTMYNDKTAGKQYKFVISGEGADEGLFTIDAKSGEVFVTKAVDREKKESYHITFDVWDESIQQKIDKELAFDVDIKDINDNPPVFHNITTGSVAENTEPGYLPISMDVTDQDKPNTDNSTFTVSVTSQTPAEPKIVVMVVNGIKAQLKFEGCFDYDKVKQYRVVITATDKGKPPLSSSIPIVFAITDQNSHPPVFKQRLYKTEAIEMKTNDSILRIGVEDKDTPNTDGWRAVFYFISGNEEGLFNIRTDPKTNEGILSVVKEKNYKNTTLENLKIGVKNVQELIVCKDNKLIKDSKALPPPDAVSIEVTMIDDNDPPTFEKYTEDVYQTEETAPGEVLYTPKVHDVDSTGFKFVMLQDPAGWVTLDEKTGKITTVKKMDRESPFVDEKNIYRIVIAAVDNGKPPATSTCTVKVHLKDINDNTPKLLNSSVIMCGNKVDRIAVPVTDADAVPYSGPFIFNFEDETLKSHWKLDPANGENVSLVSHKKLPNGNHSVKLVIEDQQNLKGYETLGVVVCDCEEKNVCRGKLPLTAGLSLAAIGQIIAALLLFLILLAVLTCGSGMKDFAYLENDVGTQSLTKYNDEGGGADCKSEPVLTPVSDLTVIDGAFSKGTLQKTEATPGMSYISTYNTMSSEVNTNMNTVGSQRRREPRSGDRLSRSSTWNSRRSTRMGNSFLRRSMSTWSEQRVARHIDSRLEVVNGKDKSYLEYLEYKPKTFADEGQDSRCQSLDELSINNMEEDLHFLDDLGPKFKTLGEMCQHLVVTKEVQLQKDTAGKKNFYANQVNLAF